MQLTASKETLMLALGRTLGIVGKKTTMPVLSNLLVQGVTNDRFSVTATDLDIFSRGEYTGLVEGKGKLCVSAKDLHEIVRNLPAGNVQIEAAGDNYVKVSSGQIVFKIRSVNPSDYPETPGFGEVPYIEVESKLFKDLIEHTLFSVANDDPRIFLNGVNVERIGDNFLRLVSTDGHRLSLIDKDLGVEPKLDHSVIIPRKGLVELRKLLDEGGEKVKIGFSGSNGFVLSEDLFLVMRLIEGDFPDYNMVIPKASEKIIAMDRSALQDALKRISILSSERSYGVRFRLGNGELAIEASSPERGEGREVIEADYSGAELSIGFNARYLLDVIAVIQGDKVLLEMSDELSPCVVKDPDESGFLSVIMPMRIN